MLALGGRTADVRPAGMPLGLPFRPPANRLRLLEGQCVHRSLTNQLCGIEYSGPSPLNLGKLPLRAFQTNQSVRYCA